MRPLRILLVANADRRREQGRWYSTEYKLRNGLIRCGHMVLFFSDRDAARELSWLPTKKLGIRAMNARLIATARHFRPDLVIFGHADLCDASTFAALREGVKGVRLAQFNVDATFRGRTMAAFRARAAEMDMSFSTTGDAAALAALAPRPGSVCYMPNPVDASIETARVFETPRAALDWDGLFLGTGIGGRKAQLEYLAAHLPQDYRFHYGGRAKGAEPLVSTDYLEALTTGATCPILPLDDAQPSRRFYASDRIAQVLGQGVLAFTHASAGLSALYEDGVVEWQDRGALVEAMARYGRDDAARRQVAQTGWRIAHERTSAERVAEALVSAAMGHDAARDYGWPVEPLA